MSKTATVSARINEEVKAEAEGILQQLGIPVSVLIDTLYHQIIIQREVPFSLTLNSTVTSGMSKEQLNSKFQHSYSQAIARQGRSLDDVFSDLEDKHKEKVAMAV